MNALEGPAQSSETMNKQLSTNTQAYLSNLLQKAKAIEERNNATIKGLQQENMNGWTALLDAVNFIRTEAGVGHDWVLSPDCATLIPPSSKPNLVVMPSPMTDEPVRSE